MKKYTLKDVTEDLYNHYANINEFGFVSICENIQHFQYELLNIGIDISKFTYDNHLSKEQIKKLISDADKHDCIYIESLKSNVVIINGLQGVADTVTSQDAIDVLNTFSFEQKLRLFGELVVELANNAEIEQKVKEIENHIAEAEQFANETSSEINLYVSYGMGGTYDGKKQKWYASSQSC